VIDDSFPHSFVPAQARRRIAAGGDVVCTAGGVLRAPYPLTAVRYHPRGFDPARHDVLPWLDPREIGGCPVAGLLPQPPPHPAPPIPIGLPAVATCHAHLRVLQPLGFGAAAPHCDGMVLSHEMLEGFRRRFGSEGRALPRIDLATLDAE